MVRPLLFSDYKNIRCDMKLKTYKALVPYILKESKEIVGVAFLYLDCGCIKVCKLSGNGYLIEHIFLNPLKLNKFPICLKCDDDKGSIYRVIHFEIIWADDESKMLNGEQRLAILRKAFGGDFLELGVFTK